MNIRLLLRIKYKYDKEDAHFVQSINDHSMLHETAIFKRSLWQLRWNTDALLLYYFTAVKSILPFSELARLRNDRRHVQSINVVVVFISRRATSEWWIAYRIETPFSFVSIFHYRGVNRKVLCYSRLYILYNLLL